MAPAGITNRIVAILEAFSHGGDDGLAAAAIIQRSGLPPSTVYRLLAEFEELGLVHRTADKRLRPNFRFERLLSFSSLSAERLTEACARLSDTLQSASEIIVLQGQSLFWHLVRQHPAQAIRLRAHTGYVRESRELDSITRMALAHCPVEFITRHWDTSAFYDVGVTYRPVAWDEARERLTQVDRDGMQFDLEGNAKGVRRFCVAVRDGARIACLLTVAEAATPLRDEAGHIAEIRELLFKERAWVEAAPSEPFAQTTAASTGSRGQNETIKEET